MATSEGYEAERSGRRARLKPRHGFVMGPPGVGPLGRGLGDVTNLLSIGLDEHRATHA